MTPEQARQLLEGTTPGPWKVDKQSYGEVVVDFWVTDRDDNKVAEETCLDIEVHEVGRNFNLIAAAPDMANMIAGMSPEYAVQGKAPSSDEWITLSQWSEELPSSELELGITLTYEDTGETYQVDTRIVMRYVPTPQPLEGEEQ